VNKETDRTLSHSPHAWYFVILLVACVLDGVDLFLLQHCQQPTHSVKPCVYICLSMVPSPKFTFY